MAEDRDDAGGADEQRLLREVHASLEPVAWVADADTRAIKAVNERAIGLLGHSRAAWTSQPGFWAGHLHADDRATVEALVAQVLADGHLRTCLHRFADAEGASRWFYTTLRLRTGAAGRELVGVMLDVTERERAQLELAGSGQRMRLFCEQIPAIVYTVDRALRFTSGAGAALASLGLRLDSTLAGISLYEYFRTDDDAHPSIAAHRRAIEDGARADFELTWAGRTFQAHVEPFRDGAGAIIGAIGVSHDITERKRAELERDRLLVEERAARAAAEDAVRARDEFVSVASHELCTPVTSLLLTVQRALRDGRGEPAAVDTFLAVADRQTRRLSRLVRELLDVSRVRAGRWVFERERVDLVELVREVVGRAAQEAADASSPLALTAPEEPMVGRWDGSALDRVASNLIANALKFGGGRPIEVRVERAGARARLVVRDQGIGIDPARLPFIFDRFERAVSAREYGGFGLGLFIARQIVDAHGGTVAVESALGAGSTFTVELPLQP